MPKGRRGLADSARRHARADDSVGGLEGVLRGANARSGAGNAPSDREKLLGGESLERNRGKGSGLGKDIKNPHRNRARKRRIERELDRDRVRGKEIDRQAGRQFQQSDRVRGLVADTRGRAADTRGRAQDTRDRAQRTRDLSATDRSRMMMDRNRGLAARARQSSVFGQQGQLAGTLAERAMGQGGPSVAELQMRQGLAQQMQNASAMAGANRGNSLLAQRQAQIQNAQASAQTNAAAAQLRAQEQIAAQQNLGGVLAQQAGVAGQMRQGDQFRQAQMSGRDLTGRAQAINQGQLALGQGQLGVTQGQLGTAQEQLGANIQQQGMNNLAQQRALTQQILAARQKRNIARKGVNSSVAGSIIGGGGSLLAGVGGLMASSDERVKENVSEGSDAARELLEKLSERTYRYREEHADQPGAGRGERLGIMAQDLERSRIGRNLVSEGPDGVKRYDVAGASGAALAALAYLNKRVNKLEKAASNEEKG